MADYSGVPKSLTVNSSKGGTVIMTVGADASPPSQDCQSCLVQRKTGTTAIYMNINAAASADTFLLVGANYVPVPVQNLSQLHFYSAGTDIVQILWRG